MNKKKFLNELEKKLNILDEKELNETLEEYKDIIEEKVKDGKTEEEAVSEFGSIDELVDEILKAYKINPKKINEKEEESLEGFIKDSSKKLADASKNLYEKVTQGDNNLGLELVFEILIKFILMLIGFMILKLPFNLIEKLGHTILSFNISTIDIMFRTIWSLVTAAGYLVTCAIIFIVVFKPYFKGNEVDVKKEVETKEEKNKKKIVKKEKNKTTPIVDMLKFLFKLFIIIFIMIPLIFTDMGLIAALTVVLYYFFVGIRFIGLILLLLGILIGFSWLTDIAKQLAFGIKKIQIIPVVIAIVLTVFGSLLFVRETLKIEYINEAPKTKYKDAKIVKEFDVNPEITDCLFDGELKYNIDENMPDGKIKIVAKYKKDYIEDVDISLYKINEMDDAYRIRYHYYSIDGLNNIGYLYNLFIDNLKKNKVYNYDKIDEPNITIIANKITIENIKK